MKRHLTLVIIGLLFMTITRCSCLDGGSPSESGDIYVGQWVQGKMEVVGSHLKSAIQHFKSHTAGLDASKDTLFQLVTTHHTVEQIYKAGENMQYGQFMMSESAQKTVMEEVELNETNITKILSIKEPNNPMLYQSSSKSTKVFTTNFGDRNTFFGYKSSLFAQDEVQIAEMPHLAILKYYYDQEKKAPLEAKHGEAAVFINVPRYVDINTKGIYGNDFRNATKELLQKSLTYRNPITDHHILSIVAPNVSSQAGQPYELSDFSQLFLSAFCAYQATHEIFPGYTIQVETGNWGTGAFGNDIRVSALAQILAATLSNVHLNVYPFDETGKQGWKKGTKLFVQTLNTLQKEKIKLTPTHVFNKAQELATQAGNPLRKHKGNGT